MAGQKREQTVPTACSRPFSAARHPIPPLPAATCRGPSFRLRAESPHVPPPAVYNPVENRRINVGKNYARPDRSGRRIYPPLSPVAPTAFPRPVHRPERPFSIHAPPFHMVFTSTAARRLYALRSAPCAVPQAVDKSKDIGGPDGDNETDKFSVRKVSTVSTAYHQHHRFLLFSTP